MELIKTDYFMCSLYSSCLMFCFKISIQMKQIHLILYRIIYMMCNPNAKIQALILRATTES